MAFKRLSPTANYVTYGFGQVEPNHLSAQRTAEIYAQLPADKSINILENGQFVKYDYALGVVDFSGPGEWMLVFNEVKVYADRETDQDFAMIRRDYVGNVYSPIGVTKPDGTTINPLLKTIGAASEIYPDGHTDAGAATDFGRNHFAIGNKYEVEQFNEPQIAVNQALAEGANGIMVPRVFKTHEGDIFTTNTIKCQVNGNVVTAPALGEFLQIGKDGYLASTGVMSMTGLTGMVWQVVKVYNLGDLQPAVKVMRVQ